MTPGEATGGILRAMEEAKKKILVTGAVGLFGRFIVAELLRHSFEVVATDLAEDPDAPVPVHLANLLDLAAVRKLLPGIDGVIHLGNHPYQREAEVTINENVAMNTNVFQSAVDSGVSKILFASSVQVIGSEGGEVRIDRQPRFASFPLSDETLPFPTNTYALSKLAGETQLDYYATGYGIEGIAIRFPGMHPNERHKVNPDWTPRPATIRQGFSNLTYEDAARLVVAVLNTTLPGFRIYFPSSRENRNTIPTTHLLREFYPNIPCRRTLGDQDALVDISRITRETGWEPQDRYRKED